MGAGLMLLCGALLLLGLIWSFILFKPSTPSTTTPVTSGTTVEDLMRAGRKIEAIRLYREQTGVGLKEAKDAVEAMAQGRPPVFTPPQLADQHSIEDLIRSGQKLPAIKLYREQTGVGLKEAKDAIEALERDLQRR